MDMPRKLTVSMLSVTVIMLSDIVESVMLENEEALEDKGGNRGRRRRGLRFRPWRDTLVWSVVLTNQKSLILSSEPCIKCYLCDMISI